jgi:hypothetical protein
MRDSDSFVPEGEGCYECNLPNKNLPLQDDSPTSKSNFRSKRSPSFDKSKIKNKNWIYNINGNLYEHIKAALQSDQSIENSQKNHQHLIQTSKSSLKRRDLEAQVSLRKRINILKPKI